MMPSELLIPGWLQHLFIVLLRLSLSSAYPLKATNGTACTARGPASYILVFTGQWSPQMFPKQYPLFRPPAQWSKLVGKFKEEKEPFCEPLCEGSVWFRVGAASWHDESGCWSLAAGLLTHPSGTHLPQHLFHMGVGQPNEESREREREQEEEQEGGRKCYQMTPATPQVPCIQSGGFRKTSRKKKEKESWRCRPFMPF